MLDNLSVRTKFLAAAAVPANVLVVLATIAVGVAGDPLLAVIAGVGAVATLFVAHHIGSTLTARLSVLSADLATTDLDEDPPPDAAHASDEIGDLERAVHRLQRRAGEHRADARQASSRFVRSLIRNLSERNHVLLDRQIEHIDWLEATEEDPDRLEALFELDHLAIRMRRICESMMVVAGTDSIHDRVDPAPATDVIRVAIGENADYRKIQVQSLDDAMIDPGAACELTHVVSELLANATRFSPQGEPVELYATLLDDGSYRVTIIDQGSGMDDDRLAKANAVLSDPPDLDADLDDEIGLHVTGRLARQLGAIVTLSRTAGSGVTAEVVLPSNLVGAAPDPTTSGGSGAPRPQRPEPIGQWVPPTVDPEVPGALRPRVGATVESGVSADVAGTGPQPARDEAGETWQAAVPTARAAADQLGLKRRERRESSASTTTPGGPPARSSTRKPDEVRSMITKYRDGLRGGQDTRDRASDR
ncbi:MAG: hypothetical protein OEV40_09185 [Acidimicrobiia bacterium]|nr:hypothetical protein [Acidimicrobiia bacterium]